MVACLISAALLSYGGINSFVIIFAIYPIALKLFEEADLPTYLLPGIAVSYTHLVLGAGVTAAVNVFSARMPKAPWTVAIAVLMS